MYGRARWHDTEATIKDENNVLIRQEHSSISKLFKVIQDTIPLILLYMTMSWFRTVSSSTYIILDVRSIYNSITNSGLTPGRQNSSWDRQMVFFTVVNPLHENHQEPEFDLSKPRIASYKQKWKVHQDAVCCVDVQVLNDTLQSLLYLDSCCDGFWRNYLRESLCVTSAFSNDFFQRSLWERIGSRTYSTTIWRSPQQSQSSQSSQPNPNPDHDRTEKLVVYPQRRASRSQLIETRFFREEAVKMMERWNPLSAVTQITSQEFPKLMCSTTNAVATHTAGSGAM